MSGAHCQIIYVTPHYTCYVDVTAPIRHLKGERMVTEPDRVIRYSDLQKKSA